MKSTNRKKIAVFDTETDPFKQGRIPEPFTCAFFDGSIYIAKWGPNCVNECLAEVAKLGDDYLIYVHNGGKFDFWFMFDWIDETKDMLIIAGRLVEFSVVGTGHIFRDSLAIIPVPLSEYNKEVIDYRIFEADKREKSVNASKIKSYLKSDCVYLWELVTKFAERFKDKHGNVPISVGQASIRELTKLHPFEIMTESSDAVIRPYYMGGRVQCFRAGILKGPWNVYDVNSMYPKVMAEYEHPLQDMWELLDSPPRGKGVVWFAEFEGSNRQALPIVTDKGLDFTLPLGRFFACSHELVPAIAAGMVHVKKWHTILRPMKTGRFDEFVGHWYGEKVAAKKRGDRANELFAKFISNSAYGKTGQNPADFKDYKVLRNIMMDDRLREQGFEPDVRISDDPFIEIWSRKSQFRSHGYYNVSIAASVTSAARAVLLNGLQLAIDPIYCDTDSIICRDFSGPIDSYTLGAWKLEATAEFAAIAGKKMYCLYNMKGRRIEPVKWASKGGKLEPEEIIKMAKGEIVEKTSEVPTYSLSRGISFTTRKFRKTVDRPEEF